MYSCTFQCKAFFNVSSVYFGNVTYVENKDRNSVLKKKGTHSKQNNQTIKEFLLYVNMFIYSVEIVTTTQLCTV